MTPIPELLFNERVVHALLIRVYHFLEQVHRLEAQGFVLIIIVAILLSLLLNELGI